jgi:ABC-type sugar transport system substrate-binding protein
MRGTSSSRRIGAALALTGCLALSSCGSPGSGSGQLQMGIAVANIGLNFAHEMVQGAQSAAGHEGGVSFKAVGPPSTDGPAEEQLFRSLTTTSPDGIVLENLDPPIFTRPAAQAIGQGIPVVALDTAPTPGSKIGFYVGNDNYELGTMLADETLKRLPGNPSGTVLIGVPNPGTPVLDSRAQGLKDTFNKKAPGIKVLGPFQTYSDPNQNYNAWLSLVHANPKALAFLGVGDADSYDLAKIKQTEHGKFLVAGADVDDQTLRYVKSGQAFVTIDPEHVLKGYVITAMLIRSVKEHKPLPAGWLHMPGLVVDRNNIDKVIERERSPENAYRFYKPQIDEILANPAAYLRPMSAAR